MVVGDREGVVAKRVRAAGELRGRDREERVEVLVGVLLVGDLQVAVADHVEQDHRPDRGQRRRPLFAAGARVVDVLAAAADAVAVEVALAARLLAVEGDQLHGGPGEARRQRAGELEQDGDAGGAVVGADEARDAAAWCRSGRRRRRCPGRLPGIVAITLRQGRWIATPRARPRACAPAISCAGPLAPRRSRAGAGRARPARSGRRRPDRRRNRAASALWSLGVAAPAAGEQREQCRARSRGGALAVS